MGLLNYIKFQTIAQLISYHLDQSSPILEWLYEIANYLTQLQKQLSDLDYTIKNGETFTKRFMEIKIPPEYKIILIRFSITLYQLPL